MSRPVSQQDAHQLQSLVRVANDAAEFYADACEQVDEAPLRDLFGRMAAARRRLADTLGERLSLAGEPSPDGGSIAGRLQRGWAELRTGLGEDRSVEWIAQLEQAEDRLLEQVRDTLRAVDDPRLRESVAAELPKVRAGHDEMRALKRRMTH